MGRPDFAVVLYHGTPARPELVKPEGFMLWSQFVFQAAVRFSPAELLVIEWRLRGGGSWSLLERDLTLIGCFPGSGCSKFMADTLASISESKDATIH